MQGFLVNEGPAVLFHGDRLFISYSASATDENYCMGLLWIDVNADPLVAATGINHRNRYSEPVTRTGNMAPVITALPKPRTVKMCWSTMRETIRRLKATRFTIQTAIPA
jgi:hypothetical protein